MVGSRTRLSEINLATSSSARAIEEQSKLLLEQIQCDQALKIDMESLYQFGALFLDQWSMMIAYVTHSTNPEAATFHQLVGMLDAHPERASPIVRALQAGTVTDARWLWFQCRSYRNKFVVHPTRRWQRSTVADVVGENFALFTPSPPGLSLLPHAPAWLQDAAEDYWERARPGRLLERIVENIGAVSVQGERERIAAVVARAGLTTPSFHVLAHTLASFASSGSGIVATAM